MPLMVNSLTRLHSSDRLDPTSVVVPSSTPTRSCAQLTANRAPPTTPLVPVPPSWPSKSKSSRSNPRWLIHNTTPKRSITITWLSPPPPHGTTTNTLDQSSLSQQWTVSSPPTLHARHLDTATPNTSSDSPPLSHQSCNGSICDASPTKSAKRHGDSRHSPADNNALKLLTVPRAWVTPAVH